MIFCMPNPNQTRKSPDAKLQFAVHRPRSSFRPYEPLPPKTISQLNSDIPKGSRNPTLAEMARQFRDARYPQGETETVLVAKFLGISLPLTEAEIRKTISSTYSRPPRDPNVPGAAREIVELLRLLRHLTRHRQRRRRPTTAKGHLDVAPDTDSRTHP